MIAARPESAGIAGLPEWVRATIAHDESFRFEALTLLEQAKAKLAGVGARPPGDSSSVAVAVLPPMHLAVKALLAAKGYRATSMRGQLALLRVLYGGSFPPALADTYVGVQAVRVQGATALEAAQAFVDAAAGILSKSR
jgi:hypothetical protein